MATVRELSQAFALTVTHAETFRIRDDVGFLPASAGGIVQANGERDTPGRGPGPSGSSDSFPRGRLGKRYGHLCSGGLDKPDISVLSEEFLAEVHGMTQRNLAVELLQKLLRGELPTRRRANVVQARSFSEMLEQTLRRYQNRAIEAAQVVEELIQLAREMREANARGERLDLTDGWALV